MAEAQQEENHWPGFVDALSTIVMVVTFLLIILAIAIFVMSLSIAEQSGMVEGESAASQLSTNVREEQTIVVADNPVVRDKDATVTAVTEFDKILRLEFTPSTIEVDQLSQEKLKAYLDGNAETFAGRTVEITAFFNPNVAYTKARRVGYYRVLSARNAMTAAGVEASRVRVHVREANTPERIDTVEVSAR
ncbi:MAG: hypothetical protein AAF720_08130 [Pseudomonadota bacterium]